MTLLVTGLVLFVALHLVPGIPPLRQALVTRMGEKPYRAAFSLIALVSIVLVGWGFARAPYEPVYTPPGWGRHVAMLAVPVALVLFAAANMPTHIRAVLRHPMMLGLLLWAVAHLLANGDLRSILLFGAFGGFAVIATLSAVSRGKGPAGDKAPRLTMDAAAVAGGLIAAGLLVRFHATLFGMPVL